MTSTQPAPAARPAVRRETPPGPGPLRPFHFPPIDRFELPNGMRVLAAYTPGLPVVTVSVLVDAAGIHEQREHAGLATVTGALLESGAGGRSAAEIADALDMLGVQLTVGTGWEVTHLEMTGLLSRARPAVEILADLVRHPTFPAEEVERIRAEHQAAILQRRAEPRGLANEMAARAVFAETSPFSRPLGGTSRSLAVLTREDVVAFHAGRFSPHDSTVLVAGNVERAQVEDMLTESFADWSGAPLPRVEVPVAPRSSERQVVIVHRPGSVQSEIRVGHLGVPRSTPDYFPIAVMNAILGGAFTSRLNMNLRERQGFTYGVSSAFSMRRHPGAFLISTAVQTEVTAPALAEIFREVEGIREREVTSSELEDARSYLAGVFPLRLQTTEGVASRLAEMVMYDLPDDYFEHYRERILQVEADAVHRAASGRLRPDQAAVVIAGDADQVLAPVQELGLGEVRVVDAGELG